MSKLSGFNIEDMVNVTPLIGGEETQEPKFDQLMSKLRRLQQGNRVLEEEIKDRKSVSDSLQKELATLQTESYKLEEIYEDKEEFCRNMQLLCEETEQDSERLLEQNKQSEELLEQYRCEIQEFWLKQRKQRMMFENQLHQLIEQHKNLHSIFTPERLPNEIKNTENTKSQLISAEQRKLAQLHRLNEELEEVREQRQLGTAAADTLEK